jgi:hypothetical protein
LREASVTVMLVFFMNLIIRISAFPDSVNRQADVARTWLDTPFQL